MCPFETTKFGDFITLFPMFYYISMKKIVTRYMSDFKYHSPFISLISKLGFQEILNKKEWKYQYKEVHNQIE